MTPEYTSQRGSPMAMDMSVAQKPIPIVFRAPFAKGSHLIRAMILWLKPANSVKATSSIPR